MSTECAPRTSASWYDPFRYSSGIELRSTETCKHVNEEDSCYHGTVSMKHDEIDPSHRPAVTEDFASCSCMEELTPSHSGPFVQEVPFPDSGGVLSGFVSDSHVVSLTGLDEGITTADIVDLMELFGRVASVQPIPKLKLALIEFEKTESAYSAVEYAKMHSVMLLGRPVSLSFSQGQDSNGNYGDSLSSNALLITVMNQMCEVTADHIRTMCSPFVEPQRIVVQSKSSLRAQFIVEFLSPLDAGLIMLSLNGRDLLHGGGTLRVSFVACNTSILSAEEAFEAAPGPLARKLSFESLSFSRRSVHPSVRKFGVNSVTGRSASFDSALGLMTPDCWPVQMDGVCCQQSEGKLSSTVRQKLLDSSVSLSESFSKLSCHPVSVGGEGYVIMVYGLNMERMNCERLFNLFCLYGNVIKVKYLTNKLGSAMVQYSDKISAEIAIRNLNNFTIFGGKLQLSFSKHPFIADSSQTSSLPNGSPSALNYSDSRNNRFKYIPGGVNIFTRIHQPSKVLHYFNAPPDVTEKHMRDVFSSVGAELPVKFTSFLRGCRRSSSGLVEFSDVQSAVESLVVANHFTMHREGGGAYTLKLAFSPSNSINN